RKQRKGVDSKLIDNTNLFNQIFDDIQRISYDFVKEIDQKKFSSFNDLFNEFQSKIEGFKKEIPNLQKNIREFGIY
ncbi:MAG: hypothetical protein ACFFAT_22135, partial [Promethearchaeota archaeon]